MKKGKLAIIKCPVDSTILDNDGAYVAGVFDPAIEVSKYLDEEKINYFTIGDSKFSGIWKHSRWLYNWC
jgi:hypothetical protein